MKLTLTLFTAIAGILFLSSYDNVSNKDVDLMGLADKDFKYIFKFDNQTSAEEIASAEDFLKQYDSAVTIKKSKNDGKVKLIIKTRNSKCEADNFKFGLISLDKNNDCRCAIGEKSK